MAVTGKTQRLAVKKSASCRSALPFRVLVFGRQIELDDEPAVSLGLLRKAQICGSQVFKFGADDEVSFCVGVGEKFKSFRPVIIPRGH